MKMFTSGFKPKSTTVKAKKIIRSEIHGYYSPKNRPDYSGNTTAQNVALDAQSGWHNGIPNTDYHKGANLVDSGCFACYYNDQRKMLGQIYGKDNVEKWDGQKVHQTYKHLIAREYTNMRKDENKGGGK
jgi:hypothetical protein